MSLPKAIGIACEVIKKYEGCELIPYECPAGYLTRGWGHLTKDSSEITQEQADKDLQNDAIIAYNQLQSVHTPEVFNRLTEAQKASLTSFIFNLGIGNYNSSTLKKMVDRDDTDGVVRELGKWRRGAKLILRGLVYRRATEAKLYETGRIDFQAHLDARYVY